MKHFLCFEAFRSDSNDELFRVMLEYLQSIRVKKSSLGVSQDYEEYLTKDVWKKAKQQFIDTEVLDEDTMYEFINDHNFDDDSVWDHTVLKRDFKENVEEIDPTDVVEAVRPQIRGSHDAQDLLTKRGYELFKDLRDTNFEYAIHENGLVDALEDVEEDGNLPIYRAVSYKLDKSGKLKDRYAGLGIYWSFKERGAEPHHGYPKGDEFMVTYHAKVNLKDVDWVRTLICSSWHCKSELEVRVKEGVPVEVTAVEISGAFRREGEKRELNPSIIVRT